MHLQVSEKDVYSFANNATFFRNKDLSTDSGFLFKQKKILHKIKSIDETTELNILINYICNFSCSYCYSAKGRSGKSIDRNKLLTTLDFFINAQKKDKKLQVTFSGGGDPLLSFPLLKEAIMHADYLASRYNISIKYGIVTNGTLLNQEVLEMIKQYNVNLVVSFDVLKDIQNKQRGKYNEVCAGINYLIENDIYPGIRSTITPLNVHRMNEMAEEIITGFPALGGIAFEPVLNRSLFKQPADLKYFYTIFTDSYFSAYKLGLKNNFYVGNTFVNSAEICKERACLSKFTLTPEGEITACSRISSPKEDFYEQFHYGSVTSGNEVMINTKKLQEIMNKNVYRHTTCQSCIAKWHCSGGCLLARYAYPPEYFEIHCDFVRNMLVKTLLTV
ncbi:MAG: radical SAM protein [Tannerella sp.]|nr:radical SAM protein [Tannerella sp.]